MVELENREIEQTIFETFTPVNTIATAGRLIQICEINKTNSAMALRKRELTKAQAIVLLLWEQCRFPTRDHETEYKRIKCELLENKCLIP